jgi:predicted alpha/beta hydrolase family esterase
MKVLILHGWGGSDYPHWQSYIAGELAKDYGHVSFFKFSDMDFPKFDIWQKELEEHLIEFKPDIVVCHSLANILWFHLCNNHKINSDIKKLYLVAPPSLKCDIKELQSFYPINIPTNLFAKKALLISSTNDPYMTLDEANELQKSLKIQLKIIENGGHINTDSGYGKWEWMLKEIKSNKE